VNRVRETPLDQLASLPQPTITPLGGRYGKLADLSFAELQRLLTPVEALERDATTTQEARAARDSHPARRAVVVAGGQVLGLLTNETLAGDTLSESPFGARGQGVLGGGDQKAKPGRDRGAEALPERPATGADEPPSGAKSAERVFNHWLEQLNEDGTSALLDKTTPLKMNLVYELKINLAAPRSDSFAQTDATFVASLESSIPATVELLDVTIALDSEDFAIYGSSDQILTIARGGFSKNTVSFAIEAKRAGDGHIRAAFFYEGRCFQVITFRLKVGGQSDGKQVLFAEQTSGTTLLSAFGRALRPEPRFSLVIVKRENGYQFILTGAGVTRAFVPLSPQAISQMVNDARDDLLSLVQKEHNGDFVYQSEDTFIPKAVHEEALTLLAERGTLLFQRLFSGTQGGPEMGELIKRISREKQLHIEVVAEQFIFPWALLYNGELDPVDPNAFWGFKHVIEYLPEFTLRSPVAFFPELLRVKPGEKVPMAFVANTNIDSELTEARYPPVIEPQTTFFQQLGNVAVERRTTTKEFFDLLKNPDAPPLIYLNCHAVSNAVDESGGVYKSRLRLTDGDVDLDKLDLRAPVLPDGLRSRPLIFLNACQSAALSPYLYAGLVPAMLARGARGVIGTEVNTPALFAAEFAQKFIDRFTAGNLALGDLLLQLRREYLEQSNNVMGLVYALYSSGELVIVRE
jgi:hypothetical protein